MLDEGVLTPDAFIELVSGEPPELGCLSWISVAERL
jgi:hypothetical protein